MLKVRLVSNYADSKRLTSEVLRQFAPKNVEYNFEFVYDDSYDLLFIFNKWDGKIRVPKENVFALAQEPTWSQNFKDWNGQCAEFVSPTNNLIPMMFNWTGIDYESALDYNPKKTKACSFVVSKANPLDGTLYQERNELVQKIMESDLPIDLYGRGWDFDDTRYKGEIYNKSEGLSDYHTSIYMENSEQPYYVTEKFWDIVICNTFPIPYNDIKSNPIEKIKSFITLCSVGDNSEILADVKDFYFDSLNIFNYIKSKCQK